MKSPEQNAAAPFASSFAFATCNAGSESALKAEVARTHGSALTPAFMRPGLITWKSRQPLPRDFDLRSVFARVAGVSLGLCKNVDELAAKARAALGAASFHLHVFPREVSEEGVSEERWQQIDATRAQISAALQDGGLHLITAPTPTAGEWVLDLITESANSNLFAGLHRHDAHHHPLPGALPRIALPADAPSRAYLKIEQALAWRGIPHDTLRGLTALELGSAPGGGSLALLHRGMNVIGADTGEMDSRVIDFRGANGAHFTHLRASAGSLAASPLPRIDLLLSDMNLAPPAVLKYVETLQRRVRAKIVLVTLKLNDRAMESQLPGFIAHFQRLAPGPVFATQLPANRREVCLFSSRDRI